MSIFLLHPAALWTAVGVAAVVLLHLLQPRWKRRAVPSLIIWRRVLARGIELSARRPSVDVALILGAAAAACLVLASAGPRMLSARGRGRELVIVLDNGTASLTESARARDRLAESKELAREMLSGLEPGSRAALVATSPSPHLVAAQDRPAAARRALGGVRSVQITGSLAGAVAVALAQGSGAGEVAVFTSRELPPAPARVRRILVGEPSRNLAITHADFSEEEAFAAVRNFSSSAAEARVRLRVLGPEPREIASAGIRLQPLGRSEVILAPAGEDARALERAEAVEILLEHSADDVEADNAALAARTGPHARRVALVGVPSEPVTRALRAARVEAVSVPAGTELADVDAVVYSGEVPDQWPPERPSILIAPAKSVGPVRVLGDELRDVRGLFVNTEREGSLTRGFPPLTLGVRRAVRSRILSAHTPLITAGGETLAAQFSAGGMSHVYIGFRPEDSDDWPRRASFPVFIARALESVRPRGVPTFGGKGPLGFARVGDSAARHLPPEVTTVRLPGGGELPAGAALVESGLYRAGGGSLAVNLVSSRESDNRLGRAAPAGPQEGLAPAAARFSEKDLAGALAALALALLATEWIVSARRS